MKTKEIQTVYTQGLKVLHPCLRLYALKGVNAPQFTVVVSKHVSKRAVDRNRIKRRMRAQFKLLLPRLNQPAAVVMVAQGKALDADSQQLAVAIAQLLRKAKLLV